MSAATLPPPPLAPRRRRGWLPRRGAGARRTALSAHGEPMIWLTSEQEIMNEGEQDQTAAVVPHGR